VDGRKRHLLKALTQHLTGRAEKGKECCVRIGHQADILTQDIPHMRLECDSLNLIIKNLSSKSKSPSKNINAVYTSSPKQTSQTLLSNTAFTLKYMHRIFSWSWNMKWDVANTKWTSKYHAESETTAVITTHMCASISSTTSLCFILRAQSSAFHSLEARMFRLAPRLSNCFAVLTEPLPAATIRGVTDDLEC